MHGLGLDPKVTPKMDSNIHNCAGVIWDLAPSQPYLTELKVQLPSNLQQL